jgi:DNA replication protein DnaC
MVDHLKAAEDQDRLISKLTSYLRPSLLVVDEVGYQPLERTEANLVFQVISKRYKKGSIILTSNKTFGEWGQVFGDEILATAILDSSCTTAKSSPSTATATGSRTDSKPSNGTPTWPNECCT